MSGRVLFFVGLFMLSLSLSVLFDNPFVGSTVWFAVCLVDEMVSKPAPPEVSP